MAKVRVYELAKELGIESKVLVAKLQDMGEFVRSASSTIEAPVIKKLKKPIRRKLRARKLHQLPLRRRPLPKRLLPKRLLSPKAPQLTKLQ